VALRNGSCDGFTDGRIDLGMQGKYARQGKKAGAITMVWYTSDTYPESRVLCLTGVMANIPDNWQ